MLCVVELLFRPTVLKQTVWIYAWLILSLLLCGYNIGILLAVVFSETGFDFKFLSRPVHFAQRNRSSVMHQFFVYVDGSKAVFSFDLSDWFSVVHNRLESLWNNCAYRCLKRLISIPNTFVSHQIAEAQEQIVNPSHMRMLLIDFCFFYTNPTLRAEKHKASRCQKLQFSER